MNDMNHTDQLSVRREVLRNLGASPSEVDELISYGSNQFRRQPCAVSSHLVDEPFVCTWRAYQQQVEISGDISVLAGKLLQLCFPVEEGISNTALYQAATLRGLMPPATTGLSLGLAHPSRCTVQIYATPAGNMPVILAESRRDFELLVQAFTRRNEPVPVPRSMGACMVSGYNNWDRVAALRKEHAASGAREPWADAFARIRADKTLYQDRFILLSSDPYSAVAAHVLGIAPSGWLSHSIAIRLEHECMHYCTLRLFGSMRNALFDELIADYFGIRAALGFFRSDWLLTFWGLESFPAYRAGGRLENYRGEPPLSSGAFIVLQRLAVAAAVNLETFDRSEVRAGRLPQTARAKRDLLCAMTSLSVEQIAHGDGVARLTHAFRAFANERSGDSPVEDRVERGSAGASQERLLQAACPSKVAGL